MAMIQAVAEYGGAVSGTAGAPVAGSASERLNAALETLATELGNALDFAVAHPGLTAFGVAMVALVAVIWAVSVR